MISPNLFGLGSWEMNRRSAAVGRLAWLLLLFSGGTLAGCASISPPTAPAFGLAFANFAPTNTDLFIADADGKNEHSLLPDPALDYDGSFSADGRWIVFTSNRAGSADIWRVHVDGTDLKRLTDSPAFDDQGALSPDGRFLAFVSSRSGQADIWILELATGRVRNITHDPGGDFRPAWSPDGKFIAFSSVLSGKR